MSFEYRSFFRKNDELKYLEENFKMIMTMIIGMGIGSVYSLNSMRNTFIVWIVLFCLMKAGEFLRKITQNVWCFIFIGSVITYFTALWLHTHPKFVISLF